MSACTRGRKFPSDALYFFVAAALALVGGSFPMLADNDGRHFGYGMLSAALVCLAAALALILNTWRREFADGSDD